MPKGFCLSLQSQINPSDGDQFFLSRAFCAARPCSFFSSSLPYFSSLPQKVNLPSNLEPQILWIKQLKLTIMLVCLQRLRVRIMHTPSSLLLVIPFYFKQKNGLWTQRKGRPKAKLDGVVHDAYPEALKTYRPPYRQLQLFNPEDLRLYSKVRG